MEEYIYIYSKGTSIEIYLVSVSLMTHKLTNKTTLIKTTDRLEFTKFFFQQPNTVPYSPLVCFTSIYVWFAVYLLCITVHLWSKETLNTCRHKSVRAVGETIKCYSFSRQIQDKQRQDTVWWWRKVKNV